MEQEQEQEQIEMPAEHVKEQKHPRAEKLSVEILEKKENPVLDRVEIAALAHADKTPSKEQVKEALVAELKVPADSLVLKNVLSSFGSHEFKIHAYLYKSKETMQKLAIKKESKEEGEAKAE